MNTYELTVRLSVKVEAFDLDDAKDAVLDSFGIGDDCGVEITSVEIAT